MMIKSAGKTDIGLVRKLNEDSIKLVPESDLYIVCDGMGGHNAGEVASASACDMVAALYAGSFEQILTDERLKLPRVFPPSTDVLIKAVRIANHWIHTRAASDPGLSGMGTTIVALAIEQDIATILHVGDSRIYRLADRKLYPLTIDHSWAAEIEQSEKITAEEAKAMVNRNVITRALGVKSNVDIDVSVRKVREGEIYIMCSDGLCGFVDDGDIRDVAASCNENIDKICDQLIQLANQRGGSDNVSIIALKITGGIPSSDLPELETVTVDGEPIEYYSVEEDVAQSLTEIDDDGDETVVTQKPRRGFSFFAAMLAIVVLAAIFYVIFKG